MPGISDLLYRRWLRSLSIALLVLVPTFWLSGCASLTTLYFHPQEVWVQTPDRFDIDYEDVWLSADDGTELHAWLLKPAPATEKTKVILYLHGNAENISTHSRSVFWLVEEGYTVLALDYRGFGASQGRPILPDVLMDAKAGASWLRGAYPDHSLVVLGQSMGAALAVNFVADYGRDYDVSQLILEAPFAGFRSVAREMLQRTVVGTIVSPLVYLIPSDWDPKDRAPNIHIPVMQLHSPMDPIVPLSEGEVLFEALPADKRCFIASQGPHIASFRYSKFREQVADFLVRGECPQVEVDTVKTESVAGFTDE
ncbi:MAG: alpha/beta fold hydrolase [Thalassolituus sp.]|jgi:hypothetical protein|uniref:alpha/beta hydrolase n=1 Tax=Thalassolituus sp. TaxID=2030822 RepID=UPI0027D65F4E|nr:alpha/beta fold hydrolase [Thalassolituus sp.]MDQ4422638.1 alpha/beta fold hydrolase [Thalassolituus sp.]MDQ4425514.1 alpha/beta fold hydrolase [Thalassolituus sp.]